MELPPYLSASQIGTLEECGRKYIYRYVLKIPETFKSPALTVGSAFHKLLEGKDAEADTLLSTLESDGYPHRAIVRKMRISHEKATAALPQTAAKEIEFTDRTLGYSLYGFVDAVRVDTDGSWFLCEHKTAASVDENKRVMLATDLQVNTYAYSAPTIAAQLGLDKHRFQGVYYTITTKPRERVKKSELPGEYIARATVDTAVWKLTSDLLQESENIVKAKYGYANAMRQHLLELYEKSGNIHHIPANQKACFNFNSPCPYFKECYGVDPVKAGAQE